MPLQLILQRACQLWIYLEIEKKQASWAANTGTTRYLINSMHGELHQKQPSQHQHNVYKLSTL